MMGAKAKARRQASMIFWCNFVVVVVDSPKSWPDGVEM